MLQSFKDKLNAPSSKISLILICPFSRRVVDSNPTVDASTTPPGSPPKDPQPSNPTSTARTSEILAALASLSRQVEAPPANSIQAFSQESTSSVPSAQNLVSQQPSAPVSQAPVFPPSGSAMSLPFVGANVASQFPGFGGAAAQNTSQAPAIPAFPAAMPQQANFGGTGAEALQQQVLLIQLLMQQGIPQDQWGVIMQALSAGTNAGAAALGSGLAGQQAGQQAGFQNLWGRNDNQRDIHMRSPPPAGRYQRDRSLSPPPRRRDSPTYENYDNSTGRGDYDGDRRGRGRVGRGRDNDYRQRSPPGNRHFRSPETPDRYNLPPGGSNKWVDHDPTVGKDNIKGTRNFT